MTKTLVYLAGISIGLVLAVILGASLPRPSKESPETTESKKSPAQNAVANGKVVLSGIVDEERGLVNLYPLQPGRVEEVPVREGQKVAKGEVLLRLDARPVRFKVRQAEADLQIAQAKVAMVQQLILQRKIKIEEQKSAFIAFQHMLEGAQLALTLKQNLRKQDFLSKEEVELTKQKVLEVQAGLKAEEGKLRELDLIDLVPETAQAAANLLAKQAQLEEAKFALEEHALRAPVAGEVVRIMVQPGDVLGSQPTQPAIQFCSEEKRVIRIEVEQEFANRLQVGDRALVQDYANPEEVWKGQVVRRANSFMVARSSGPPVFLSMGTQTRTLECLVELDPGQPRLLIGQRVRVTIEKP